MDGRSAWRRFGSLRTAWPTWAAGPDLVDAYGSQVPINHVWAIRPRPRDDQRLCVGPALWCRWKRRSARRTGLTPWSTATHLRLRSAAHGDAARTGKWPAVADINAWPPQTRGGDNEDCARKKDGVIGEDEEKRMESEVQKITDEAIKRVDEALKTKEQEIMHV